MPTTHSRANPCKGHIVRCSIMHIATKHTPLLSLLSILPFFLLPACTVTQTRTRYNPDSPLPPVAASDKPTTASCRGDLDDVETAVESALSFRELGLVKFVVTESSVASLTQARTRDWYADVTFITTQDQPGTLRLSGPGTLGQYGKPDQDQPISMTASIGHIPSAERTAAEKALLDAICLRLSQLKGVDTAPLAPEWKK